MEEERHFSGIRGVRVHAENRKLPRLHRSEHRASGVCVITFSALKGSYTKIPNELLNDPTLSWKAKGLYCHMASKSDNYNFTVRSLAAQFPDGVRSILNAINELKKRGWVNYNKSVDGTGKYSLNTTLSPVATPDTDNGIQAEPNIDKGIKGADPNAGNGIKGGEPKCQNPNVGFGNMPKQHRINKKDLNNKKYIYKEDKEKARKTIVELKSRDGDPFGSSTRFTTEEILDMLAKGVIDIH